MRQPGLDETHFIQLVIGVRHIVEALSGQYVILGLPQAVNQEAIIPASSVPVDLSSKINAFSFRITAGVDGAELHFCGEAGFFLLRHCRSAE